MPLDGVWIAKRLHRAVRCAIGYFSSKLLRPVITGNPINSRYRARINSSMSHCRKRRKMTDYRILTGKTIIDQSFKTAVSIAIIITI